ncbi:MAG: ATP-dependent Clp protease ATP-binding subunit, partial [Ruminococcus sp.]|nr:ATP-dependent Clp protease ATP-binding subunit [Ruminococcus sp.]
MIMCSNCKKRPAVVFITSVQGNEKKNEGLCLACARERKIPQVAEYMEKLGITDEEIDQLSDQMMGMLDGDSFEMGGQGIMPDFIADMFGGEESKDGKDDVPAPDSDSEDKPRRKGLFGRDKSEKKEKKKELKFLGSYCTNLSQKAADGQLDRIIGRDKEIARVIQILSRRTKNNP